MAYPTMMLKFLAFLILLYQMTEMILIPVGKLECTQ